MERIETMYVTAIITAGGLGSRMGSALPKQFIDVKGKPILAYSLLTFENCPRINEIILTSPAGYEEITRGTAEKYKISKVTKVITGGDTRQQSVYYALQAEDGGGVVIIHDAARPFVTEDEILRVIDTAEISGAGAVGVPVTDTIKICDENGFAVQTLPRDTLWQVQTPQAFLSHIIKEAHKRARENGICVSDDTELADRIGRPTRIIMGNYANIKITTKEDLSLFK